MGRVARVSAGLFAASLLGLAPAHATEDVGAGCACDAAPLRQLQREIAAAPSVEEARARAAPPLALARSALTRAGWILPGSRALAAGARRLEQAEADLARAATPAAVAAAFGNGVAGSPVLAAIDIDAPSCHYSTGEIIAIVLGFILGIIPGLILLVLLC